MTKKKVGAPKGNKNNPKGRPKGIPNKDTRRFKVAINLMLESAADDMVGWLSEIDDPVKRFAVLKDFTEYLYPKLARVEQNSTTRHVDKDGNDILREDLEILRNSGLIKRSQDDDTERTTH
jgi:hypothetical protein